MIEKLLDGLIGLVIAIFFAVVIILLSGSQEDNCHQKGIALHTQAQLYQGHCYLKDWH